MTTWQPIKTAPPEGMTRQQAVTFGSMFGAFPTAVTIGGPGVIAQLNDQSKANLWALVKAGFLSSTPASSEPGHATFKPTEAGEKVRQVCWRIATEHFEAAPSRTTEGGER